MRRKAKRRIDMQTLAELSPEQRVTRAKLRLVEGKAERAKATRKVVLLDGEPTPEAVKHRARQRPDILDVLKGRINQFEVSAAEQIRLMVEKVERNAYQSPSGRWGHLGTRIQTSPHHLDRVPVALHRDYMHRYIPWTEKMRAQKCGLATYYEITMAILIHGRTLRQVERQHGLRNGRAAEALIAALRRY